MSFSSVSAAWLALGAVLVGGGFATLSLGWAALISVLLFAVGGLALMGGFIYAYRRGHETLSISPEAFIVGNTKNSEFSDNETTAARFQIGDSVDSKYRGNRAGRRSKPERS